MSIRPLLFVAMPFGTKTDPTGRIQIDFDDIYARAVKPAALEVGLDVIRADEEIEGGLIHLGMYERLLLAEFVVADLTLLNANVFYELGVRHAARPRTTVLMFATVTRLPFDAQPIRALPYELHDGVLREQEAGALRTALVQRLSAAREQPESHDSPLFQLIRDYRGIELAHEVTESFRDRVRTITAIRDKIDEVRDHRERLDELVEIERDLRPFDAAPLELLIDLLLAYRSVSAWQHLIDYVEALPETLRMHATVQEQLAQALGRRNDPGDRIRAIEVLRGVVERFGSSAETSGILGGIYKRMFEEAFSAGRSDEAAEALTAAIDAYEAGLNADPRDTYPGINLLSLLTRRDGDGDSDKVTEIAPVVSFALSRRDAINSADYWDVATVMELAVLMGDWQLVGRALGRVGLVKSERWMVESTADNLAILRDVIASRGDSTERLDEVISSLRNSARR